MAAFTIPGVAVTGIASALPQQQEDNFELACLDPAEREDFIKKTGIRWRRVAPAAMCASDLCFAAAEKICQHKSVDTADIDALLFVTQTPDFVVPGNSLLLQQRLGLSKDTLLLDINQGCAGYVYGLATASALIQSMGLKKVLLLVGDTITRLLSPNDRTTRPVFSDAGSATLLESDHNAPAIHFDIGADGSGAKAIWISDGGSRRVFSAESLVEHEVDTGIFRAPAHLAMQGIDVSQYALRFVAANVKKVLEINQISPEHPDYFIFHQANKILNDSIVKKLKIAPEKAPETLSVFGNTSSASIPVTICHGLSNELNSNSLQLVLSGFGVGFSWGSAVIQLSPGCCIDVLEIA